MFKIVHTKACAEQAKRIASRLPECELLELEAVNRDPESLGDFGDLGLVFDRQGKGLSQDVVTFIKQVLGSYDLSGMRYMFSVCVCDGEPFHSLKIVEKLCSYIGCAPSLSITMKPDDSVDSIASKIESGEIFLAEGSFGTTFYMMTHGIKRK